MEAKLAQSLIIPCSARNGKGFTQAHEDRGFVHLIMSKKTLSGSNLIFPVRLMA